MLMGNVIEWIILSELQVGGCVDPIINRARSDIGRRAPLMLVAISRPPLSDPLMARPRVSPGV